MESLILALHIFICVLLVILVLLQSGKEGMGVIFGGGNTSVFGSSGAGSLLAKMTAFVAVIFVCTSLAYTYVTTGPKEGESVVLNVRIEENAPEAKDAKPAEMTKSAEQAQTPEATPAKEEAKPAKAEESKEEAAPAPAAPAKPEATAPAQPQAATPSAN